MKISTKKAFTLVEMTFVILLLGVIGIVVATMIVRGFQSYRYGQEAISSQEEAAKAMRDFEKNARGSTQVIASTADTYEFYAYLLGDEQPAPSKVRYFSENGEFKKGIIEPTGPGPVFNYPPEEENVSMIIKNVTNGSDLFRYFNDTSSQISDPVPTDAVRMVQFQIMVDKDPNKSPDAVTTITRVNLRNLKTNL
ncbi:MAG: type II secretion system protein [Patescibacteria group bacterium]|jgi:type II secretory pathway pseudopilin PulG